MESINNIKCKNIMSRSILVKNVLEMASEIGVLPEKNINDPSFSSTLVKDIDKMILSFSESYIDILETSYIERIIEFCEKYILVGLEKKMKSYYASYVFPVTKDMNDIYDLYNDPSSENVISPNNQDAMNFISKYEWFLKN